MRLSIEVAKIILILMGIKFVLYKEVFYLVLYKKEVSNLNYLPKLNHRGDFQGCQDNYILILIGINFA